MIDTLLITNGNYRERKRAVERQLALSVTYTIPEQKKTKVEKIRAICKRIDALEQNLINFKMYVRPTDGEKKAAEGYVRELEELHAKLGKLI